VANFLSPYKLLEEMKTAFAADASGATARVAQLQNAIVSGLEYLWCGHGWRWNLLPQSLVTVASQEYTTLPSDYGGLHKMGEYIYDTSTKTDQCIFVSPSLFDAKRSLYSSNGRPEWFTIRNRLISSVSTPVVEWAPTPGAEYTWAGWSYFREAPTLSFTPNIVIGTDAEDYECILAHTAASTNKPITGVNYATYWTHTATTGVAWATGTDYSAATSRIFPYAKFDVLWKMAAYGFAIKHGLQLSEANEKLVGLGDFKDMMNEARAQWGVEDVSGLHHRLTDVQGDFANALEGGAADDEWWLYK
jgi:hypothetical protein